MKKTVLALGFVVLAAVATKADDSGFASLFDGRSFDGWKASENVDSWKVEDGTLVCAGPRSHLFYVGDMAPFKNFVFKADVMTTPGSNAGIYFHTKWQEEGWPKAGFEAQVNNSHKDPKRTGSLYGVVNVMEAPAKDNEWYEQEIVVQGKRVQIKVNGKTLVDYTEPKGKQPEPGGFERVIGEGTFALQAHDPNSKVYFKNIRVKKLP